jgi:hypothetical protein
MGKSRAYKAFDTYPPDCSDLIGSIMPLPEYKLDERRVLALTALYAETRKEITRYRDYEWRITSYAVALFAGCIALGLNKEFSDLWNGTIKGVFMTLLALTTIVAFCFLLHSHYKYIEQRKRRTMLDKILGFSSKGFFEEGSTEALVGEQTITSWKSMWYPIAFFLLIGIVGVLTILIFAFKK